MAHPIVNTPAERAATPASSENTTSVSKTGNGDFATISEAIAASLPGASILIDAGVYEEALIITKPISLVGQKGGLVIIHHPTFTAVKINDTQVVLKDLAIGIQTNRLTLSFASSRAEIANCIIAPIITLLGEANGTLPAFNSIDSLKEQAQQRLKNLDNPPQSGATPSTPNQSGQVYNEQTILITSSSSVVFSDCLLDRVQLSCSNSQLKLETSTILSSAVVLREQSIFDLIQSNVRFNVHGTAMFACQNSTCRFVGSTLSGIRTTGIHCESSEVTVTETRIDGTYTLGDDLADESNAFYRYNPTGIKFVGASTMETDKSVISRFRNGIVTTHSSGFLSIKKTQIIDNYTGVYGFGFSI